MAKPRATGSKKPPGMAIDHRRGQRIQLSRPGIRFDPPDTINDHRALQAWEQYWNDPVSSLLTRADRILLDRWIETVQRYYKLMDEGDTRPVIHTDHSSYPNPAYKVGCVLANTIERMQAQLGIGPKNRSLLGLALITPETPDSGLRSVVTGVTVEDDEDEPDPRLI